VHFCMPISELYAYSRLRDAQDVNIEMFSFSDRRVYKILTTEAILQLIQSVYISRLHSTF